MLKRIAITPAASLVGLLLVCAPVGAQEGTSESTATPFRVEGGFDFGYRALETTGNKDKYFEDLNLRSGPRLFNLDLRIVPVASDVFDLLNVDASNLGDPFQSFGVTLKKYSQFNFRFRRNESAYFYRDTLVPHELANIRGSTGGDFHTFNHRRVDDQIDFDFDVSRRAEVFVKVNRWTRVGESTTTLDIQRDEFELDRPLDEVKNDYTVGFQWKFDNASLYFDETYRSFQSSGRTFLPGASFGENTTDSAELFFVEQLMPFDYEMPQSTIKVNLRPDSRLQINAGFIYSDLDADLSHQEEQRGVSFRGAPFTSTFSSAGSFQRSTTLADVDVVYDLHERLSVIGGVRSGRFDQDAEVVDTVAAYDTRLKIATNIVEAGVQVVPARGVMLTGGVRRENRDTEVFDVTVTAPADPGFEGVPDEIPDPGHEGGSHIETTRNTVFVNGTVSLSRRFSVMGEYERGDYDNPLTLISPTSMDRVKARVRFAPGNGLTVTGAFLTRRIENNLASPIHPTVGRTGEPATLRSTSLAGHAAYTRDPVSVFGSYTRKEVSHDISNLVNGLLSVPILYESDLDRGAGGVTVALTERVRVGTDLSAYRNRGSFGLDWEQYRVFTELLSPAGYLVNLSYRYNALDEVQFDFDDYSAHIVEVSLGYRFR